MYDLNPEAKEFLQRLKTETSEAHTRLEANELSKKIMSPGLTIEDYAAYLNKMLALHQVLEEKVFPVLALHFPDIEQRRKSHLIRQDLDALHAPATDGFGEDLSFTDSEAGAMGMFYVMEGSALGGKVILKQLKKTLPQHVQEQATRYFSAYGEDIGTMWVRFLNDFSNRVISQHAEPEVITGANTSFALVQRWFEK